jgi:mRNA interferase RelE/StbE
MRYDIIFTPEALDDLKRLRAIDRAKVQEAVEVHLRHEPTKLSKSRIKRLRQLKHPQFRVRVDDLRIFYDVIEQQVEVLAILAKAETDDWLSRKGITE